MGDSANSWEGDKGGIKQGDGIRPLLILFIVATQDTKRACGPGPVNASITSDDDKSTWLASFRCSGTESRDTLNGGENDSC